MEEGTILEWFVKPGDRVEYGDLVALLDTEKAEIEMESFETGTVDSLLFETGETVAVGTTIALLRESESETGSVGAERPSDDAVPPVPSAPPAPTRSPPTRPPSKGPSTTAAQMPPPVPARTPEGGRIRATPLARRSARERGIDLTSVSGTGSGGAIVEADVRATTIQRKPERTARRREVIAAAMERSKREIPHYYLSNAIEIQNTVDWLSTRNVDASVDERVLLPALLMKSVALAARRFPEMNGHWLEDGFHPAESVDLGLVVSLRTGGLVVPTFRRADERSVPDLMAQLRDVVGRARAGRLRSSEMSDATLTLTSLGDRGADTIFGVIYPPQVAIVGFGGVHSSVCAEGDMHGTKAVIRASLAADHRVSDGQQGSRFLDQVARLLRNPEAL
jgi:pyruvate dehydrogenase E2 component (dihydrolipoyllysine-residue acetyltransferase)